MIDLTQRTIDMLTLTGVVLTFFGLVYWTLNAPLWYKIEKLFNSQRPSKSDSN